MMYKQFILILVFFMVTNTVIFAEQQNINPSKSNAEMDEQTRLFLEQMNSVKGPPMETLPVEEVRRFVEQFVVESPIKLASVSNIKIPSVETEIPIRIYVPKGQGPFPVFLTFHGGGWVFGSLDLHDPFCRNIADQAHVIVVSVDYRLAPEHKFPAGLNDCYAAAEWTAKNIREWNGDPSRIGIGGDSAGGNLAAAVTLKAKEKNFPKFQAQVLIYPVMQNRFDTASYQKYADGYFLNKITDEMVLEPLSNKSI